MADEIPGPFGPAMKIDSVPVRDILAAYYMKCRADVRRSFGDLQTIDLFECRNTGYRFWRPVSVAGDEEFYRLLSAAWPNYYRDERWEYPLARNLIKPASKVLEVGCGRGYFLRSIEPLAAGAVGLELNQEAIANKVTRHPMSCTTIEEFAGSNAGIFDVVYTFQVLEHVIDPRSYLQGCIDCLRPGGVLAVGTPNADSAMLRNREDPFDLPPHHIGHFSADTYRKLGQYFGIEIVELEIEPKVAAWSESVTDATGSHLLYRIAHRLSRKLINWSYTALREPGNNIFVAFRKPAVPIPA